MVELGYLGYKKGYGRTALGLKPGNDQTALGLKTDYGRSVLWFKKGFQLKRSDKKFA